MEYFPPENLIVLVSFTGNQNEIGSACFRDCLVNGLTPVRNFTVGLSGLFNTLFRVGEYLFRILHPWVIGSQNHDVA